MLLFILRSKIILKSDTVILTSRFTTSSISFREKRDRSIINISGPENMQTSLYLKPVHFSAYTLDPFSSCNLQSLLTFVVEHFENLKISLTHKLSTLSPKCSHRLQAQNFLMRYSHFLILFFSLSAVCPAPSYFGQETRWYKKKIFLRGGDVQDNASAKHATAVHQTFKSRKRPAVCESYYTKLRMFI